MTKRIEIMLDRTGFEPSFHNGFSIGDVARRINTITKNVLADDPDHPDPERAVCEAEWRQDTND